MVLSLMKTRATSVYKIQTSLVFLEPRSLIGSGAMSKVGTAFLQAFVLLFTLSSFAWDYGLLFSQSSFSRRSKALYSQLAGSMALSFGVAGGKGNC